MNNRFSRTSVDAGTHGRNDTFTGRFELSDENARIVRCDGGCTCGGRKTVRFDIDSRGFTFRFSAGRERGEVTRMVSVFFSDGMKQIVGIKYRVI